MFSNMAHHDLKTDIQVKGIFTTKVSYFKLQGHGILILVLVLGVPGIQSKSCFITVSV